MQDYGGSQNVAQADNTAVIRIQGFAVTGLYNENVFAVVGFGCVSRMHDFWLAMSD